MITIADAIAAALLAAWQLITFIGR